MVLTVTIAAILVVAYLSTPSVAFPSAPGACPSGTAACISGHTSPAPTTGNLSNKGLRLAIDGTNVAEGGSVDLTVGVAHTVTLSGATFTGHLIRISVPSSQFVAGTNSGTASACGTIAGVGHTSSNSKTTASGTLTLTQAQSGIAVDVTAVISFGGSSNEYYYSSFTINAVSPAPVVAPVSPPTAPVSSPVSAPVNPPTSPVSAPLAAPVKAPVTSPVGKSVKMGMTPMAPKPSKGKGMNLFGGMDGKGYTRHA